MFACIAAEIWSLRQVTWALHTTVYTLLAQSVSDEAVKAKFILMCIQFHARTLDSGVHAGCTIKDLPFISFL